MKTENFTPVTPRNNGFSLVELIIVIAIMAILAAAIAPALIRYINKSRKASDVDTADIILDAVNAVILLKDLKMVMNKMRMKWIQEQL